MVLKPFKQLKEILENFINGIYYLKTKRNLGKLISAGKCLQGSLSIQGGQAAML